MLPNKNQHLELVTFFSLLCIVYREYVIVIMLNICIHNYGSDKSNNMSSVLRNGSINHIALLATSVLMHRTNIGWRKNISRSKRGGGVQD